MKQFLIFNGLSGPLLLKENEVFSINVLGEDFFEIRYQVNTENDYLNHGINVENLIQIIDIFQCDLPEKIYVRSDSVQIILKPIGWFSNVDFEEIEITLPDLYSHFEWKFDLLNNTLTITLFRKRSNIG